jgi:spore coat polysaccharide biosynthesis protein SpsF
MANVVAIIQARMGSTRLPGKALMDLCGTPVLQNVIERVRLARHVDRIVVATTVNSWQIVKHCQHNDINFYAGSEDDVLERVNSAAGSFDADIVVDITGDCPLVDPAHIDRLVTLVDETGFDYVSNIRPRLWPDGFDVQVYPRRILSFLNENVKDPALRTHTGWNINNPDLKDKLIDTYNLSPGQSWHCVPAMRLTIDYPEDLQVVSSVVKHFALDEKKRYYSAENIIDYVLAHPQILVNKHCETKEPGE